MSSKKRKIGILNYIWGGLIVFSLVFALTYDVRDFATDTYRNGQPLPVTVVFPDGYQPDARRQAVSVQLDAAGFGAFYGIDDRPAPAYDGTLIQTDDGRQLRFAQNTSVPEPLAAIRAFPSSRDTALRGVVGSFPPQKTFDDTQYESRGQPVSFRTRPMIRSDSPSA